MEKDICPKYPTVEPEWRQMTYDEFANLVVSKIPDDVELAMVCVATAIAEQTKNGKLIFPGNNPFGVTLQPVNSYTTGCYSAWGSKYIDGKYRAWSSEEKRWEWYVYFSSVGRAVDFFRYHGRRKLDRLFQSPIGT